MKSVTEKNDNRKNEKKYVFLLFVAAFFWGTTFAAQSIGAKNVGAFTYLTGRSYIGTIVLLPFIVFRDKKERKIITEKLTKEDKKKSVKANIKAGLVCGMLLFLASFTQQYGLSFTTTAKASFITTLYVVLVPVISLISGIKQEKKIWFAVALSLMGLYLLSINGSFKIGIGDSLVILCAIIYALQIMAVNHYSKKADSLKLTAIMFFVVACLSTVSMFIFEEPDMGSIRKAMWSILYAGIFSNGIAFTCQVIAQRKVNPSSASLVMCLESVFGALSGCLLLGDRLSGREICGCVLMFSAILVSELKLPQIKMNIPVVSKEKTVSE